MTDRGGSDDGRRGSVEGPGWAAGERFLTPTQKYETFLQLVRGEVTMADAAAAAGVDRTTVVRIRQVAKDGALAALAESRPGIKAGARDVELDAAKAEIARLSETVKEMAVKLMLVEGKAVGECVLKGKW